MKKINFLAGSEERFFEFMGNLTDKDRVAVVSHIDPDGLASAVIASRVIGKITLVKFIDYKPGMLKNIIEELKKNKINKTFFLDLSIDSEKEDILEIEKFSEIVIIDHHPFKNDLNSKRTIFIKAESKYPASSMCYYLFSKIQQIPSWIPAIGIIGDNVQDYNGANSERVFDDFGLDNNRDIWNYVVITGFAFVYFRERGEEIFEVFMNAKRIEDIDALKKYADIVEKEFSNQLNKYEKNKEEHGNLIIFFMKPKYSVKSLLVNKISVENPDKSFVFISDRGDGLVSASGRSGNDNLDVGEFLKNSIKGIPNSNAGGHFHAAAAKIPVEYLGKFKENLIKEYQKVAE